MGRVSAVRPAVVRSRLILEIASELVGSEGFTSQQAEVLLRPQGSGDWELSLFASDSPAALEDVARGRTSLAIVNPSALLTLAHHGVPPFHGPLPLRAIAVIPSEDQLALAVLEETGLTTVEEIASKRYPLRVSLRSQRDHGVHLVLDHVLQAAGLSLADVRGWGGQVSYDDGLPSRGDRLKHVTERKVDAIFDEGSGSWVDDALGAKMRILTMSQETLERLGTWGYRRAFLWKSSFPGLPGDVETIDFSGFAIYVREDASPDLVRLVCQALERRSDRIPVQSGDPIELAVMVGGKGAAPLDVPFHDAAAEYWGQKGLV